MSGMVRPNRWNNWITCKLIPGVISRVFKESKPISFIIQKLNICTQATLAKKLKNSTPLVACA